MNAGGEDVDEKIASQNKIVRDQLALAPQCQTLVLELAAQQRKFDEAGAAGNLQALGPLWDELERLKAQFAQLGLSKEDYLSLEGRHGDLVETMRQRCDALTAAKEYKKLSALAASMSDLENQDLSALVQPAAVVTLSIDAAVAAAPQFPECAAFLEPRRLILEQVSQAPQRRMLQQSMELKKRALADVEALKAADRDHVTVSTLGAELAALTVKSDALALTENQYLTLRKRHSDLVLRMSRVCSTLSMNGNYAALQILAILLESLRAINVAAYCPTDPVGNGPTSPAPGAGPAGNAAPNEPAANAAPNAGPAANAAPNAGPAGTAAPNADDADIALRERERAADAPPPPPGGAAAGTRVTQVFQDKGIPFDLSFSADQTFPIVIRNPVDHSECTLTGVKTIPLQGTSNGGETEITLRRMRTVGLENCRSVTAGGALTAGMSFLSAQASIYATWSSTVSERVEDEYSVPVPAHTKVAVTQDVLEGYVTYRRSTVEHMQGLVERRRHPFTVHSVDFKVESTALPR